MKDSVLGEDLQSQKALVFERRFGFMLMHKDQVTRREDRDFVNSIGRQIRVVGAAFMPTDEQGKWLVDIEGWIRDLASQEKMEDELIAQANAILRKGEHSQLDSGKRSRLEVLVDAGQQRNLTRHEICDLQYLIHAARGFDDNF